MHFWRWLPTNYIVFSSVKTDYSRQAASYPAVHPSLYSPSMNGSMALVNFGNPDLILVLPCVSGYRDLLGSCHKLKVKWRRWAPRILTAKCKFSTKLDGDGECWEMSSAKADNDHCHSGQKGDPGKVRKGKIINKNNEGRVTNNWAR